MSTAVRQLFECEALPLMRDLDRVAARLTRCRADAEDLVQETWLRAYRCFDRFQPGTDFRAWLFTIFYRARIDAFRLSGRRPRTVPLEGEGPATAPGPEARHAGEEDLARALQALPDVFRHAVLLRDVHDHSYSEIAAILQVPVGTVMSRIHRGRGLLRLGLQRRRAVDAPFGQAVRQVPAQQRRTIARAKLEPFSPAAVDGLVVEDLLAAQGHDGLADVRQD